VPPTQATAQDSPPYDHLTAVQLTELQDLQVAYKEQISYTSDDVGCVPQEYSEFFLRIPTVPGAKCKQRPYRLSVKELEEFRRHISNLLTRGIIRKATGPTDFVSPALFVPKPRNPSELCMCIDFRRLNAVSTRDFHALPDIRTLQHQMSGCKDFTALDLTSGFWTLPVAEEDYHKTAFIGPDGEIYIWTKAPMGLTNSPAAFQRFMAHVVKGIEGVSVYVDDITV
jgi:Reverse transcriptase (RNA-dependent DNA polymerase)